MATAEITQHHLTPKLNQAMILFIVGSVVLAFFCMMWFFKGTLKKLGLFNEEKLDAGDEDLGTYFQCLSATDRKRWVC